MLNGPQAARLVRATDTVPNREALPSKRTANSTGLNGAQEELKALNCRPRAANSAIFKHMGVATSMVLGCESYRLMT